VFGVKRLCARASRVTFCADRASFGSDHATILVERGSFSIDCATFRSKFGSARTDFDRDGGNVVTGAHALARN
jgi:hypothetical protein